MNKKIISAILTLCIPITLASADVEVKPDTQKGEIVITGTTQIQEAEEPVLVTVAKKGYDFTDINADKTDILYVGEVVIDQDGKYSITIPVNNETVKNGEYTIWLWGDNEAEDGLEFKYYTDEFLQEVVDTINYEKANAVPTIDQVTALLGEYDDELGITPFVPYDNMDKTEVVRKVTLGISQNVEYVTTASAFKSFVQTVSVLEAFNQNKPELAFDAEGKLRIDIKKYDDASGMNCTELYTSGMTNNGRTGVISDVTGKGFATIEEWYDGLMDSCFLNAVKYPVNFGYAHLEGLLADPKVDVDTTVYASLGHTQKLDVCRQLMEFTDEYTSIQVFSNKLVEIAGNVENGSLSPPVIITPSQGTGGNSQVFTVTVPPTITTPAEDKEEEITFNDLNSVEWAKEAINRLAQKKIINGVGNNRFAPEQEVKREEYVKMLVEAAGIQISTGASGFTDANSNAWYEKYLYTAKKAGIIDGYSDGSFGVGKNITRQECAAMLYRAIKGSEILKEKREIRFTDDDSFPAWAYDAIYALAKAEILNGKGNGVFSPNALCTRAEAAVMIYGITE